MQGFQNLHFDISEKIGETSPLKKDKRVFVSKKIKFLLAVIISLHLFCPLPTKFTLLFFKYFLNESF